jgi:hypothetical protein
MKERRWFAILAVIMLCCTMLATNSCILDADKDEGGGEDPPQQAFEDLLEREDVLTNLQLAYNTRNATQYARLLDNEFNFFFGVVDLDPGEPERVWVRAQELSATSNLFSPNPVGQDPATSISLGLTFPLGEDTWDEFDAPSGHPYEGEKWYEKTVTYTLIVRIAAQDLTLQGIDIEASVVIRKDPDTGEYRIIQWRDALNISA